MGVGLVVEYIKGVALLSHHYWTAGCFVPDTERNTLTFIFKPINNHIYYYFLCFSSLTDDYRSRQTSQNFEMKLNKKLLVYKYYIKRATFTGINYN
jgi:hypothetical protein